MLLIKSFSHFMATARILGSAKLSKGLEPGAGAMINLYKRWEVFGSEPRAYLDKGGSPLS